MLDNKQIKANVKKWVEALESGEFEQGQFKLRSRDNKYCCLGVACEVLGVEATLYNDHGISFYKYDYQSEVLPVFVKDALGLRTPTGDYRNTDVLVSSAADEIGFSGMKSSLTVMNDSGNHSFKDIAKLIRSNPPGLFHDGVFEPGKPLDL